MIYKRLSIMLKHVDNTSFKDFMVTKMNLNNYNDFFFLILENISKMLEAVLNM